MNFSFASIILFFFSTSASSAAFLTRLALVRRNIRKHINAPNSAHPIAIKTQMSGVISNNSIVLFIYDYLLFTFLFAIALVSLILKATLNQLIEHF